MFPWARHLTWLSLPLSVSPKCQRLTSRHPFFRHASNLIKADFDLLDTWRDSNYKINRPKQFTVTPDTSLPPGANLPRKEWVTFTRLRTGVGRFNFNMFQWGLNESPDCACGRPQTAQHIINHCAYLASERSRPCIPQWSNIALAQTVRRRHMICW